MSALINDIITKDVSKIELNINEITKEEPMLKVDNSRFTLFPIKHEDLWNSYKTHKKIEWVSEEIDYSADVGEYQALNDNTKYFIEHILAFFAGADGIVAENIGTNFGAEVQWPEARAFYAFQASIETVHSEVYSMLIESYVKDPSRKEELFKAIDTIPCVSKKAEWAMKWMNNKTNSFAERLVAFAVVEGVFFSGSFCAIFWLKSQHIMANGALSKSNELIARDENLHCAFAVQLYNHLDNKLSKERIHEIFKEAVEIESNFITQSIPCAMIGMNSKLMIRYIKFVSNFWMTQLLTIKNKKCNELYKVTNPFSFMDMNGIDSKQNFFEGRSTDYKKSTSYVRDYETFNNLDEDF